MTMKSWKLGVTAMVAFAAAGMDAYAGCCQRATQQGYCGGYNARTCMSYDSSVAGNYTCAEVTSSSDCNRPESCANNSVPGASCNYWTAVYFADGKCQENGHCQTPMSAQ